MTGGERCPDPRWQDGSRFSTRCVDTSQAADINYRDVDLANFEQSYRRPNLLRLLTIKRQMDPQPVPISNSM
ncbi:BBE domain-containing protein [Bradyrhizobium daqingense]|uniref:BBE domain-containing protein n=1 Tax=Bradyrhizobium daqingense TaxID=993502 RepID=UPI00384EAB67